MALSATEEALIRELLDQQAAILSLASAESTIISKLGATKVTVPDLVAASNITDADLFLLSQSGSDKNVTGAILKAYTTPTINNATESVSGIVELATAAETIAGSDATRATHPAGVKAAIYAAHTGQVAFFAMNTPPAGFLTANGAEVSRTEYANLFAVIGTTYGAGNGVSTFNLPQLGGEFIRCLDNGRGVDAGRVIGSVQGDAIRNITGNITLSSEGSVTIDGAFEVTSTYGDGVDGDKGAFRQVLFDASNVVPTADENRPRNVALLACIKY
jgi:phage-related tail fiber protein